MIVNYDPVHLTVTLDFEDGTPPLKLSVERLIVSYDLPEISAVATMEGDLEISFIPVEGEPIDILLLPVSRRHWLVRLAAPERGK